MPFSFQRTTIDWSKFPKKHKMWMAKSLESNRLIYPLITANESRLRFFRNQNWPTPKLDMRLVNDKWIPHLLNLNILLECQTKAFRRWSMAPSSNLLCPLPILRRICRDNYIHSDLWVSEMRRTGLGSDLGRFKEELLVLDFCFWSL